ncbi:MAG: protease-like activity factor CPAF [Bdellovibrionales bacterium]|nr:protease-like activity factor CPAF [Bdellovibrionales bacterium]
MFKIFSKVTLVLFSIAISSNFAISQTLTTEQKLLDFEYLISHIKSSYGPLEYKTQKRIVNIDKLITRFKSKIIKTHTNGDFYYTIKEFVSSFRDGHFSARIPTSQRASLPIRVDWVKGKVLIHVAAPIVDKIKLSKGDELLKFNNKPVKSIVNKLKKYVGTGSKQTETRWATWLISVRPGSIVPVPSGNVTLTIKLKSSGKIVKVKTKWKVSGEFLDEKEEFLKQNKNLQSFSDNSELNFNPIENLSIATQFEDLGEKFAEINYACSPNTRITIPKKATIIMQKPFVAYYYPTKKGNVGYLRIPHYSFGASSKIVFENYAYAVNELEKHTVALVIDQDHNCGGQVSFLGNIFGLFINRPVENALFRLVANKSEYISMKKYIKNSNSNIIGFDVWNNFLSHIKEAWLAGKHLTNKISLQRIYPNQRTRYTKPIVVLTDEISGSGGDAFPALMQGYNRAKIIGTRTSGLGGSVSSIPNLPFSQISVSLTRTLFYHPNGKAIENNGVTPDLPYTITPKDFNGGYVKYRKFYTKKALGLL